MNFERGGERLRHLMPRNGKDLELRGMLRYLITRGEDRPLTGVEIGVWRGAHAVNYLKCLPIQRLYLVDPYQFYPGYKCQWMGDQTEGEEALQSARKTMHDGGYADQVEFIVDYSVPGASRIPDNLDFVYIDGNHDYEYAKADLETYWPKVRWGGVIGGHDYGDGVQKAVLEFLDRRHDERGLHFPDQPSQEDFLSLTITPAPYCDWFIVKDSWSLYTQG